MNDRQCSSFLITLPALQKQQCKQLFLHSPPDLLNILLKKYYTVITTNTSCFEYFHSYGKAYLQIHCLNVRKKRILRWSNFKEARIETKLFTSTWYTALLPRRLLSISSLWFLTRHPIRIFFPSSVSYMIKIWRSFRFRGTKNEDYGLDSDPK